MVRGIFVISGSEKKEREKDKSQFPYALTVSQTTENKNKDCDKMKIINKIKSGSSQWRHISDTCPEMKLLKVFLRHIRYFLTLGTCC